MFKNLDEVFEYLDSINDLDNCQYLDSKWHSYLNITDYEEILKEVLKDKPKRVIDVGSNMNQYAYLFVNEGIDYIGIDYATKSFANPIETDHIKFIDEDYQDIKDQFADDVIISNLCIGFLIPYEDVKGKKLIVSKCNDKGYPEAKVIDIRKDEEYEL